MKLGVYIHIPFCASKCNYCDFNSYVTEKSVQSAYIESLRREILCSNPYCGGETEVDTIYFGGGTPTVLEPNQIISVLEAVRSHFAVSGNCEITIECNPATIGYSGFTRLKNAGFNRLSIGMQSRMDKELKTLGRIHTYDDCAACVSDAKASGFDNISLDLMYGIPHQNMDSLGKSIDALLDLSPKHISCYALKIEDGTPFSKMKLDIADDDECFEMYSIITNRLAEGGYERYEISNYSIPGYESRHNSKYWLRDDYIGFGAGAHSCIGTRRFYNYSSLNNYIENINNGKSPAAEIINLSEADKMSEFVFLGLRMSKGISEADFSVRFGRNLFDVFKEPLKKNIDRGTLVYKDGIVTLPSEYVYVSNSILVDFV